MSKNNVSIIILGAWHRDPAHYNIAKHMVKNLIEKKEFVIITEGEGQDCDISKKIEGNIGCIRQNEKLMETEDFDGILTRSDKLRRSFFTSTSQISQILATKYPQLLKDNSILQGLTHQLFRFNMYPESLSFAQFIQKNQIPYHGIEFDLKTRENMINQIFGADNTATTYHKFEQARLDSMVENIIKHASSIKGSGTIIVILGINHTNGLSARLYATYTKFKDKLPFEMHLCPIKLYSDYTYEKIDPSVKVEFEAFQNETDEMKKTWSEIKYYHTICQEDMGTGDFSSTEIDNIIDMCVRKSQKSSLFEIPNFNDNKLKLIEELGGKLVKKTSINKDFSQVHELFNGLISIDPNLLTKDIRSKLEINRKLITISTLEQYQCISNDPSIAIFPTENPQKFLVTFPNDKLKFLTQVVDNWEVYKKYKLVSEKSKAISMAKTGI